MASLMFFNNSASKSKTLSLTTLLLIFHLFSLNQSFVRAIPEEELQETLSALRSRGYNLFANAITTSDLRFDILAGTQFTFFAPTDNALFALDMKATASNYLSSLSLHIAPRRLTEGDLRTFATSRSSTRPPILRTLLPNRSVRVSVSMKRSPESYVVFVDDVAVAVPGLFYGLHVAVHGLDGILSKRSSVVDFSVAPPSDGDMSGGGGAATSDDGGFLRPSYDEAHAHRISPVGQDLGAAVAAPEVQPSIPRSPAFLSPGVGSPWSEVRSTKVRFSDLMSPRDGSPKPEVQPPTAGLPDVFSMRDGFQAPEVQPPVMKFPGMMTPGELYGPVRSSVEAPGFGFPVPEAYGSRPPVEAPAVQVSPVGVPVAAQPDSADGDDLVKRLEAIVGEMPKPRLGFLEF